MCSLSRPVSPKVSSAATAAVHAPKPTTYPLLSTGSACTPAQTMAYPMPPGYPHMPIGMPPSYSPLPPPPPGPPGHYQHHMPPIPRQDPGVTSVGMTSVCAGGGHSIGTKNGSSDGYGQSYQMIRTGSDESGLTTTTMGSSSTSSSSSTTSSQQQRKRMRLTSEERLQRRLVQVKLISVCDVRNRDYMVFMCAVANRSKSHVRAHMLYAACPFNFSSKSGVLRNL